MFNVFDMLASQALEFQGLEPALGGPRAGPNNLMNLICDLVWLGIPGDKHVNNINNIETTGDNIRDIHIKGTKGTCFVMEQSYCCLLHL